ncbi:hypothetical protein DWZ16_10875 [Clostridium sp. AF29-8BH]|jgi:hypothetical protein|nr:hypothetical protein DWZ16_10875 [Clostridium sp. AF29-8BH]
MRTKKLVRWQKEAVSAMHLRADDWELVEEREFYLVISNKATGKRRFVDKFLRRRKWDRTW